MESLEKDFMLTTFDNPFNPFEDFESWFKYDLLLGHNCCGLLAKEANTSYILDDKINDEEILRAMKAICQRSPMIYKIVSQDDFEKDKESSLTA